jgi:hypothetical protein
LATRAKTAATAAKAITEVAKIQIEPMSPNPNSAEPEIPAGETSAQSQRENLRQYLEQNVWPFVPPAELGRTLKRDEEDQILGYDA